MCEQKISCEGCGSKWVFVGICARAALMRKYCVLLAEGQVGKGYELAVDDPVAKLLSRFFTISTPKRKMDHSPGELEGEIDHLSKDAAVEYLLMPERIRKLEGQILGLSSQIEDLRSDILKLVQVLKVLAAPKEDHVLSLENRKYGS